MLIFFKKLLVFQTCLQAPIYKAFSSVCVWSYKIELSDYTIYMYGRGERPFFMLSCTRSRKTNDTLKYMERVRMIQCMLELSYIRTCARVLLM